MANWNGMELVDGAFYHMKVENDDDDWVFAWRANWEDALTKHYANVNLRSNDYFIGSMCCDNQEVVELREATCGEINRFYQVLHEKGRDYDRKTKKVTYVFD